MRKEEWGRPSKAGTPPRHSGKMSASAAGNAGGFFLPTERLRLARRTG
jgi:hypothetical protein